MSDPRLIDIRKFAESTKNAPVPREKMISDLVAWLRKTNFSPEEIHIIYQTVRDRCLSRTCYICGRPKPVFGGEHLWKDGDMSKPKVFRCADCKGVL
jgi:hypothetical protein